MQLQPPIQVALARRERRVPLTGSWSFEPKFDGWRCVIFRSAEGVVLQARSGRPITDRFPDLAEAALRLPPGVVVDGELVIWHRGRVDFFAVQRRALSGPIRAAALARQQPASFAAFDLLEAADTDLRPQPYGERREQLLEVVGILGPPIQPVPATTDRDVALGWWQSWTPETHGIEGLMLKRTGGRYRGGRRDWIKYKHWAARGL